MANFPQDSGIDMYEHTLTGQSTIKAQSPAENTVDNGLSIDIRRRRGNGRKKKIEHTTDKNRKKYLSRNYNLTLADYNSMLYDQNDACDICKIYFADKALAVDHDHKTGIIRGLLCSNCNLGLGLFKDDINRLFNAIKYLVKNATQ